MAWYHDSILQVKKYFKFPYNESWDTFLLAQYIQDPMLV